LVTDDWLHFKNRGNNGFAREQAKGEMMKKKVLTLLATGCFLVLFGATGHAQLPGMALRASIPFDFSIRGKIFPAGDYEIKRLTDAPDGLVISGVTNHEHELFETEPVEPKRVSGNAEIIFNRYGDSYFLSEILTKGEQTGRELPESRQERNLKREVMASNDQRNRPETVALTVY
jgi:hypothetical protein